MHRSGPASIGSPCDLSAPCGNGAPVDRTPWLDGAWAWMTFLRSDDDRFLPKGLLKGRDSVKRAPGSVSKKKQRSTFRQKRTNPNSQNPSKNSPPSSTSSFTSSTRPQHVRVPVRRPRWGRPASGGPWCRGLGRSDLARGLSPLGDRRKGGRDGRSSGSGRGTLESRWVD